MCVCVCVDVHCRRQLCVCGCKGQLCVYKGQLCVWMYCRRQLCVCVGVQGAVVCVRV